MNPEAVEWLESLIGWERVEHFKPPLGQVSGTLFTIKEDHECVVSSYCVRQWGVSL